MAWLIEVKRRTGVRLSGQEGALLEMALRPQGVAYPELISRLWPADSGDRQKFATNLKSRTARKIAGYVEWETFDRSGYRARWIEGNTPCAS